MFVDSMIWGHGNIFNALTCTQDVIHVNFRVPKILSGLHVKVSKRLQNTYQ